MALAQKDIALLNYIIAGTENGTVRWEPTANDLAFTTALRGQYTARIEWGQNSDKLLLVNAEGRTILEMTGSDDGRVNQIFPRARRNAYNVDKAIDDIIGSEKQG